MDGETLKILATRIHCDVAWLIINAVQDESKRLQLNYAVNDVAAVLTINKKGKEQGRHPDVSVINRDVWRSDRQKIIEVSVNQFSLHLRWCLLIEKMIILINLKNTNV